MVPASLAVTSTPDYDISGLTSGLIYAYDTDAGWQNSNIVDYTEGQDVPIVFVGDKYTTSPSPFTYSFKFTYQDKNLDAIAFEDIDVSTVKFIDEEGNNITEPKVSFATPIVSYEKKNGVPEFMILTVNVTDGSPIVGTVGKFGLMFELKLKGPNQASLFQGSSITARIKDAPDTNGNKSLSFPTTRYYGTVEVMKEFTEEYSNIPENVVVNLDDDYEFLISPDTWKSTNTDVEPGEYTVSEDFIAEGWTYEVYNSTEEFSSEMPPGNEIDVKSGETVYVKVINTYKEQQKYGDVMFHKYFEFVDETETPTSVNINWGEADVAIDSDDEWTELVEDMGVGNYPTSEDSLGDYWTYEIEYYVGSLDGVSEDDYTAIEPGGEIPVEDGLTTHVFVYNKYDEPENPPNPKIGVDITKTVDTDWHYTGGGPVSYIITFENTSDETVFNWVDFMDETSWNHEPEDVSNFEAWLDKNDETVDIFMTDDGRDFFDNEWPYDMVTFGGFEPDDIITITYDYDSGDFGDGTYTNTVTGCAWMGEIDLNNPVCDTDDASFTVRNRTVTRDYDPGIKIEKDVDLDEASVGDTVTYTIEVENNGDYDLEDVTVVDEMIDETWDIGDLDEGDSISKDFDYEIQEDDFDDDGLFVNTAVVTGDWSRGTVDADDTATVEELIIEVTEEDVAETTPELPDVVPEKVVLPAPAVPQALPKTGQVPPELFYGLGSILMAAGYGLGRKKKD